MSPLRIYVSTAPSRENKLFITERGEVLVLMSTLGPSPVLTVAVSGKWYELYLVTPDEQVYVVEFSELREWDTRPYVDHCPNPDVVERLAKARGWHLDEVAYELMTGRWVVEVDGG